MNIQAAKKHQVGLIFGKFYPLHCGHIYLIEKAVSQVDELHVILGCEHDRDLKLFEESHMPKQPHVQDRFNWLQDTFQGRHNIHIHILDEAGISYYPNGWKDWSDRVKSILQKQQVTPTVIFTSEPQDVQNHQQYFGCDVKLIDANREFINISATKIRQAPYQNWPFIAKAARPFFVKKIAIVGGDIDKLPIQLANIYNTQYVSNGYINYIYHRRADNKQLALSETDFIRIAMLHAQRIDEALITANQVLFTSPDFSTLHRYYQSAFKRKNATLTELENRYPFDLVIDQAEFKQKESNVAIFETALKKVDAQLH